MHAIYRIHSSEAAIAARVEALAIEQSVECPPGAVRDARVRDEVAGRVLASEIAGNDLFNVRVALTLETVSDDAARLLNMLFGNSSLQPDVELIGVEWPDGSPALPGPRFGVARMRARTGVVRSARLFGAQAAGIEYRDAGRSGVPHGVCGPRRDQGQARPRRSVQRAPRGTGAGNAARDRPQLPDGADRAALRADPAVAAFIRV